MPLNKLKKIGFKKAGFWKLEDDNLIYHLDIDTQATNSLYAFVVDGRVKYVGKSSQTIKRDFMVTVNQDHLKKQV